MGAALNSRLDRDLFALFNYRQFSPTLFIELYNLTRHINYYFPPNEKDKVILGYWEADFGARQRMTDRQEIEGKAIVARQSANVKVIIPGIHFRPFKYDYYRAVDFSLRWNYRAILPRIDSEINPSGGREISVEYGFNFDKIFKDFSFESQAGTIQEIYNQYNYHKLIFHWREYISASSFIERSALSLGLQSSFISRPVNDFLYNFAGGLPGIRGYSFYSIAGRKMVIGNAVYRFPINSSIRRQLGFCYFDKLYASAGYYGGNAWDKGWIKINHIKHAIDFGLRLDMFSFYVYPTKIAFDAAYGFNDFPVFGKSEGKEWKFYCTMLFGYDF
jgi:hypothetical protein